MHENREISSTPWSDDQGRSAKAKSHTADMHVPEKSDCAAVPVNQPNKEGQPSAEVGEERAQTRENIVQSHMHPTQNGKRMSQGLDGVRKVARERKQERFTALLHHLNVDLLRDSFYALQRKASPGVDGVTWQEYETGLEDRLVDLQLDTSTPAGKLVFTLLGAVAELERSLIVERVKAGLRNARAKGKRLGRPRKILDTKRVAARRAPGVGWKRIAAEMGVGVGTIYRATLEGSKTREKGSGTAAGL